MSSKGCVCVTSFKCCHVGGVSKVLFYSTILIDYSLEWLENDDIKVFFSGSRPLSQNFTKKTLSHNLLSTCEKWNRFCGRYNTPCFLSQKMSLLLLKFFILLSVTWARGHQNIGIMYLILKNFLCCPCPPKIMYTLNLLKIPMISKLS